MNLVVGATGSLGTEICRLLLDRGEKVRALVRPTSDQARVEGLRYLGASLVTGDLKDRASLERACDGVESVFTTASTTLCRQPGDSIPAVDQEGQLQLVAAARAAGRPRFVYISFSGGIELDSPLRTAKRTVEAGIRASGLSYTILRPSYFMEVWLSPALGFDAVNGRARVYGDGRAPISYISLADVARFAVESLDNPVARDAILELGGPEAVGLLDVVRIFEERKGRRFAVEHVPEEVLAARYAEATDPLDRSFAALTLHYARGDAIEMDAMLAAFPLRLTSVREYAARVCRA